MAGDAPRLSNREREVLQLILRGHDAKSIARALEISVHTVNERLRSARRKLGASSSREAARMAAAGDDSLGSDEIGVEDRRDRGLSGRSLATWTGTAMLLTALAIGIVLATSGKEDGAEPVPPTRPQVVRTSPEAGATVAPGPLTLSVTFDRAMRPGSYSFVQKSADTFPDCGDNRPTLSADGRTFTLTCRTEPGRSYEIWFNSPPYMNFVDAGDGLPGDPYRLVFQTAR